MDQDQPKIKRVEINCKNCNKLFEVPKHQAEKRKHCSRQCKHTAAQNGKRKACVICGIEFYVSKTRSIGAKYCSMKCYHSDVEQRADCANCRKILPEKKLTYCSWECFKSGRNRKTAHNCETCGNEMLLQPYQIGKKKFCSRPCANKAKEIQGPGWKYKRKDGYIHVYYPAHPDSTKAGWILEHRLVAEQKYGRRILSSEHVHHLNEIKDDNRPENLEVIDASSHARISNQSGKRQRQSIKDELAAYKAKFGEIQD